MRESTSSTRWDCDGSCGNYEVLVDGYQRVPPPGWRIIHILPSTLNMALEGTPHTVIALCNNCFAALLGILK